MKKYATLWRAQGRSFYNSTEPNQEKVPMATINGSNSEELIEAVEISEQNQES